MKMLYKYQSIISMGVPNVVRAWTVSNSRINDHAFFIGDTMPNISYAEMLRHPKWQRKRLEILKRDNFRCVICGKDNDMLQIHHRYYIKGKKPWQYPKKSLYTLCKSCHEGMAKVELMYKVMFGCFHPLDMMFMEDIFSMFTPKQIWDKLYYPAKFGDSNGTR